MKSELTGYYHSESGFFLATCDDRDIGRRKNCVHIEPSYGRECRHEELLSKKMMTIIPENRAR